MMVRRIAAETVREALSRQAAVALLGPRQVGKTTLALELAAERPSVYLDLEDPADRAKLTDAAAYLAQHADTLVILDEIHRVPELFQILRGVIDRGRREGRATGRFLILGSASIDLLKQSGETLAGRIAFVELGSLQLAEIEGENINARDLWIRGGFPGSLLSESDRHSLAWRRDFIRTYLERDIPQFGPRVPAETLGRFWTMLAHGQGGLLNASHLARNLSVASSTVGRYVDLLVDLLLVRRLQPHHANLGKRLVKSPKLYIRDSGILHALLGLATFDDVAGHPVVGASWEGFVIESLIAASPPGSTPLFFRTTVGAEIDLLLRLPAGDLWAIEIKSGMVPKLERGFHVARADLKPARSILIYGGQERLPLGDGIEAMSVATLIAELRHA
jgi:predicted AAA+ superfamily ATPase